MVECVNCRTDEADSGSQRHTVGHPSQGIACKSGIYSTEDRKKRIWRCENWGSRSSVAEYSGLLEW